MAEIDSGVFRQVLGAYPTGVTVVASPFGDATDTARAMVIGSFGSVSLDPPLVQFMPAKSSATWAEMADSGKYCVNVLADDQKDVCNSFFVKDVDPFSVVEWEMTDNGSPRIANCLAWIDCDIHEAVDAGDHWIVIGRVVAMGHNGPTGEGGGCVGNPLLFFKGGYGNFQEL